ncbi:cytochrome ubiquinol oxidase subunit I [Acidihalobacter ferrooxydans]|nr:cytochrome ubiquinol oxidase subunit I [Acidihalobacter ferrooxydans]
MLDSALFLTRLDFAWITTMHILYPPLTIGLSLLLFFSEWRWLRTDDEHWYRLTRFFEKLFILNFGAGVATGVTMEMAFGILFGPFSQAAGPFMGNILGYETITAFMYEAGFIGLMIFGWGKIGKKMHLFATFNVMISSSLSALWILDANSWMQTPTGVYVHNGTFMVNDWFSAILNPDFLRAFPHMWVAALELALFYVAAVCAWYLLKGQHVKMFQRALLYSILAAVIVAPLQIYIGDELGRVVAEDQPAALAAMEGHFNTYNPDGSVNTGWHIVAWPNDAAGKNDWAITIPHVLSLLETHTLDGKVIGLDQFKPADRPPVLIPFYAFRVMVAIGFALFLVALWGAWLAVRGRLSIERIVEQKWFLRTIILSAFLPYLAIWTGWWTREIARQPWVVYGLMTTAEGASKMSVTMAAVWFIGFMIFEIGVWLGTWYFFAKVIRKGPDMESPIVQGGHETLGTVHRAEDDTQPAYVRPTF